MIGTFTKGSRVLHAQNGEGIVTLRDKGLVGISFENGCVGTYGSAYFERFPANIINLTVAPKKSWELCVYDGSRPVRCAHCEDGWRHAVGNCVLCGLGPAPGKVDKPVTYAEMVAALASVGVDAKATPEPTVVRKRYRRPVLKEAELSIEDRAHLDVTGHLPEDF